jgi:uncharacterized protein (TIGR02217 family)
MSNAVFPLPSVTPGISWSFTKSPEWSTISQRSASGRETRIAVMAYPLWNFELTYQLLRSDAAHNELQVLLDFYNARQGSFDDFLFDESFTPDDSVTAMNFGTGDGSTTVFQLTRKMPGGGFPELVANNNSAPQIFVNGVLKTLGTDYTISSGLVTFTSAPGNTLPLTWTGTYYFRCRFQEDTYDFDEFMYQFFELKKLTLVGDLGLRI